MNEHVDLLQRASTRGTVRGIDRVVADARHRVRRRSKRLAVLGVLALVGTGVATAMLLDQDSSTSVASSMTGEDFVAVVPDSDRFELVSGGEAESSDRPASRNGTITIYQLLNDDGTVAAAVAVGVVEPSKQQSTLLDVHPLAEGTVTGKNGTYTVGHNDEVTNGLVIVERTTGQHTIRVAGRHLDVTTTVEVLESVELTVAGAVARIDLPDGIPAEPVYAGPDTSHFGTVAALSTAGRYRDQNTGQRFTLLTAQDRSALPVESLVWRFDGTVYRTDAGPILTGRQHATHIAYWRVSGDGWVTVYSDEPLARDLLRELQAESRLVSEAAWAELLNGRPEPTDVTTTTPEGTATTVP